MIHLRIQHEWLQDVPERYRKEAALNALLKKARPGVHPARRRLARMLRRVADQLEPNGRRLPVQT